MELVSRPRRILIVDDERALLLLLARNFTRGGYEVTVAASALDAMEWCAVKPFQAVLSDIDMPGMDGHELAQWIARNYPRTLCVLMSGLGFDCDDCPFPNRCLVLRKPFVPKDAVGLITEMLAQRV